MSGFDKGEPSKSGGVKFDTGKVPMNLLAGKWLEGVSAVLAFGAKKYHSWNWRKGIVYSRLFDAAQRHLWSWNEGEDFDPESELHHLLHASCCLMFLYIMTVEKPELDDRFGTNQEPMKETPWTTGCFIGKNNDVIPDVNVKAASAKDVEIDSAWVTVVGEWEILEQRADKPVVFYPDDQDAAKMWFKKGQRQTVRAVL